MILSIILALHCVDVKHAVPLCCPKNKDEITMACWVQGKQDWMSCAFDTCRCPDQVCWKE